MSNCKIVPEPNVEVPVRVELAHQPYCIDVHVAVLLIVVTPVVVLKLMPVPAVRLGLMSPVMVVAVMVEALMVLMFVVLMFAVLIFAVEALRASLAIWTLKFPP